MYCRFWLTRIVAVAALVWVGKPAAGQADSTFLTVYAGVSTFPNPVYDSAVLVDFPFSINRNELTFYRRDSLTSDRYAYVFAQVNLLDTTGRTVDSVSTYFSVRVDSKEEAEKPGYRVFNRVVIESRPGRYSARLTVSDVATQRRGEFFIGRFEVPPSAGQRLAIGGLCPAYSIEYVGGDSAQAASRLVRSGFKVVPNPIAAFSQEDDTVAFIYGEVYNLAYEEGVPSLWESSWSVEDGTGSVFRTWDPQLLQKPGRSAVLAKSLDIREWPYGRYQVRVVVRDLTSNQGDTATVSLAILPPRDVLQAAIQSPLTGDPYDTLSLEVKIHLVTHLLSPDQLVTLTKLSDQGKLNYLDQYWREHDEDPYTTIIENRVALMERYVYCNQFFSTNQERTNGWRSDRGRIYMTYGPWEEIDDRQSPSAMRRPYQVWYYHSLKEGKVFVFEDLTGNFEYRLVHSNVYGEVYSQEWQDILDEGLESARPLDF